jgi:hypothetical protein
MMSCHADSAIGDIHMNAEDIPDVQGFNAMARA